MAGVRFVRHFEIHYAPTDTSRWLQRRPATNTHTMRVVFGSGFAFVPSSQPCLLRILILGKSPSQRWSNIDSGNQIEISRLLFKFKNFYLPTTDASILLLVTKIFLDYGLHVPYHYIQSSSSGIIKPCLLAPLRSVQFSSSSSMFVGIWFSLFWAFRNRLECDNNSSTNASFKDQLATNGNPAPHSNQNDMVPHC